jgi:hypothetical protein
LEWNKFISRSDKRNEAAAEKFRAASFSDARHPEKLLTAVLPMRLAGKNWYKEKIR